MLEDNPFFMMRTQGVGVISRELAEDVGISRSAAARLGRQLRPAPRRARTPRTRTSTSRVPVETAGDCFARYRVRMVEFRESIKIVRQALDGLPEGPISSRPGLKSVAQIAHPEGRGLRARRRARAARSAAI